MPNIQITAETLELITQKLIGILDQDDDGKIIGWDKSTYSRHAEHYRKGFLLGRKEGDDYIIEDVAVFDQDSNEGTSRANSRDELDTLQREKARILGYVVYEPQQIARDTNDKSSEHKQRMMKRFNENKLEEYNFGLKLLSFHVKDPVYVKIRLNDEDDPVHEFVAEYKSH